MENESQPQFCTDRVLVVVLDSGKECVLPALSHDLDECCYKKDGMLHIGRKGSPSFGRFADGDVSGVYFRPAVREREQHSPAIVPGFMVPRSGRA